MDDLEIEYTEDDRAVDISEEQHMWSHNVLTQFELLVDSLGIETVMFLMSKEHEAIINSWVKEKIDIQNRRKQ